VLALAHRPVDQLVAVMRLLRSPDGCPWDREQTLESLKPFLVEETYEALDAVDSGDSRQLCGELGDVLLQIVFQSQIASESGDFTFQDVARGLVRKLIRRHPHVFGDAVAKTAADVVDTWEKVKKREGSGLLSGVPRHLPGLLKAHRICQKAARVGFDWPDVLPVLDKVAEEAHEVARARGRKAREHEVGDLLFAVANLARHLGVDPEDALQKANARFIARFRYIEKELARRGKTPAESTLAEMDALWEKAKKARPKRSVSKRERRGK
jgi:MazG family protein